MLPGHLYAVHTRELIAVRQCVVKFGKVKEQTLEQRLRQYPKGSVCLTSVAMSREFVDAAELALLAAARKLFKPRRDLGKEYFECDRMVDAITLVHRISVGFVSSEFDKVELEGEEAAPTSDEEDATDVVADEDAATDVVTDEDVATDVVAGEDAATDVVAGEDVATDVVADQAVERRNYIASMDIERRICAFVRDTRLAVDGMTGLLEDIGARYVAWCDIPGAVAPKKMKSVFVAGFGARIVPSVQGPVVVFPSPPPVAPPQTTYVREFLSRAAEEGGVVVGGANVNGVIVGVERHVSITRTPGVRTALHHVQQLFKEFMLKHHTDVKMVEKLDKSSLGLAGWAVYEKKINVCQACYREAPDEGRCCGAYDRNRRSNCLVIHDTLVIQQ
jgi:hypothetical protein